MTSIILKWGDLKRIVAKKMKPGYKLWIETEGKAFGSGPHDLLELVYKHGSLRKAAAEMHMSYSQAWHLIRTMEERLGFPLLIGQVGGREGGGSALTPEALQLMKRFEEFRQRAEEQLNTLFTEIFHEE